jgi:hypothetical protein
MPFSLSQRGVQLRRAVKVHGIMSADVRSGGGIGAQAKFYTRVWYNVGRHTR